MAGGHDACSQNFARATADAKSGFIYLPARDPESDRLSAVKRRRQSDAPLRVDSFGLQTVRRCVYLSIFNPVESAVGALKQLAEIYLTALGNRSFANECLAFADEVSRAVNTNARARHLKYGEIYAYETDGFGNRLFMDDANVPSLLSLPYLGCCAPQDATYRNTRAFVLSGDNPYFFRGRAGEGIGGPHVGLGMIWHLGIIMRALTSVDAREIGLCLKTLKATHAGTGFMHEAFAQDDPQKFTRAWFAWANTLFGELVLQVSAKYPQLLTEMH